MPTQPPPEAPKASTPAPPLFLGLVLLAAGTWAYWPTLHRVVRAWTTNPEYSHGFVVPLFAAFMLFQRREMLAAAGFGVSWLGCLLLTLAVGLQLGGAYGGVDYLEALSLVAFLFSVVALIGGWAGLRWAWPGLLFLIYMIPLPFTLAHSLSGSLRTVGTVASGFFLQMIGFPVVIEGQTFLLDDHRIAVAEACSGLSMLYVFIALATAVAYLVKRPLLDRAVILLSAIPIAIIANVVRIALTALAYRLAGKQLGDFVFHDLAGWLMMPLALGLTWGVIWLLDWVLVPADDGHEKVRVAGLGV
ncbi:MAG: exosortase/archaeosortase family protein [Gemmataceae bacterium]